MGKQVWCPTCNETVELEGRSTLVDTTRQEVSYHYDREWKSAGSSVRYVPTVERVAVAVCPTCGREPPYLEASTEDEFWHRRFGTEYRIVLVGLGALLIGGNCYVSCGGLGSGFLGTVLTVILLSASLLNAPGAWRLWMAALLGIAALCTVLGEPWRSIPSPGAAGPAPEPKANGTSTAFASDCNVRGEPAADAELVGTVAVGRQYPVVDRRNGWTRVRLPNGTQGWVGCKTR